MGLQGIAGPAGAQGVKGDKGDKGDTGAQGVQGAQGAQGVKGDKGDKGDTGAKGDKGDQGSSGTQGSQGLQGNQGAQGSQGTKGDPGVLGIGASSENVLIWDSSNGEISLTDCAVNQVLKFDGTEWNCAADNDIDTNTTYTLGWNDITRKLTLTPSSGAVTELMVPDTDTTYTAGSGLGLNSGEFSIDCGANATVFCQGGNSFGTDALLGTKDNHDLDLATNGVTRMGITNDGQFLFNAKASSSTAFSVSDGTSLYLTINTAIGRVQVGDGTGSIATVLALDGSSVEPATATNGSMYYNTAMNKFRCYENGNWTDCISRTNRVVQTNAASQTIGHDIDLSASGDCLVFRFTKTRSSNDYSTNIVNNCGSARNIKYNLTQSTPADHRAAGYTSLAVNSSISIDTAGSNDNFGYSTSDEMIVYVYDSTTGKSYTWTSWYNRGSNDNDGGTIISTVMVY
jgi:hypothetical protein